MSRSKQGERLEAVIRRLAWDERERSLCDQLPSLVRRSPSATRAVVQALIEPQPPLPLLDDRPRCQYRNCGKPVPPGRRKWCSDYHRTAEYKLHTHRKPTRGAENTPKRR